MPDGVRAGRWMTAVCAASVFVGSLSCAANDSASDAAAARSEHELVELFSWWTAPGEAQALQALVDTHKAAHPAARLFNAAAASGSKAREMLDARLEAHDPPDLFQQNMHDVRQLLKTNPGTLEPLDGMFDAGGLRNVVFPEVIRDVTIDGHVYAMPVNLHRENALFYNRSLFDAHGVKPPATLDELLAACAKLKAAGVVPIATSHQGWILRIMFNSIVMGKMGSKNYHDYFTGVSKAPAPLLREGIDVFAEVLEKYTNPDADEEGFGWTNAALAVYNGDAAMFLHGDWAKGYLVQLGFRPEIDFGVLGAPGASEMFLYGVDVFALPKGAPNEQGARDFLTTVASPAGQVAFNKLKGSSPIRLDIPRQKLDAVARVTMDDLEHAKYRMLVRGRQVWDDGLAKFAKSHDREALFHVFVDNPPEP